HSRGRRWTGRSDDLAGPGWRRTDGVKEETLQRQRSRLTALDGPREPGSARIAQGNDCAGQLDRIARLEAVQRCLIETVTKAQIDRRHVRSPLKAGAWSGSQD